MMQVILGRDLLGALVEAGIIPNETYRVVIDATVNDPVVLYVMQYGTEELLKVIPSLEGIKIEIVGQQVQQEQGDGVAQWYLDELARKEEDA
jgi:hypothetical protein